jgi:hypothetical protein
MADEKRPPLAATLKLHSVKVPRVIPPRPPVGKVAGRALPGVSMGEGTSGNRAVPEVSTRG